MAAVTDDLRPLFDEIRELLAAPRDGDEAPGRERLEHTLTSGYARALELQAERERIDAADPSTRDRLAAAAADLSNLRQLLEPLRDRVRELRVEESREARPV